MVLPGTEAWNATARPSFSLDSIPVNFARFLGADVDAAVHFKRQSVIDLRTREPDEDFLVHIKVAGDLLHDLLGKKINRLLER